MKSQPVPRRHLPRSTRSQAEAAPALSQESIVQAALALVESDGLTGFSTRKLGLRLQCEAMSIYHHFPSKQHLLDALVDHALNSLPEPPEGPPLERLRAAMHDFRAMARRFPALFPLLALHRLNTPAGVRFIENMLTLVQAAVPDQERAARHFRTLGYYLMGAGLDETAGYAKGPSAAVPASDAFILRECPRLAASARWFQPAQWDATFALGVEAMLAAVARDAQGCG